MAFQKNNHAAFSCTPSATEHREHATRVQQMDRRREDVRDSFLDMVDAENENAVQALETPLEVHACDYCMEFACFFAVAFLDGGYFRLLDTYNILFWPRRHAVEVWRFPGRSRSVCVFPPFR